MHMYNHMNGMPIIIVTHVYAYTCPLVITMLHHEFQTKQLQVIHQA